MISMRTRFARARVRARGERGYTLIELLVATVAGLIVCGAAFTILDTSLHFTSRINDQVDASQLGRDAMSTITQNLHSACVAAGVTPIQAGSDGTHLNFISAFGAGGGAVITPTLHNIALSGGTLTDTTYAVASGSAPTWTFSTTPSGTRTLVANVSQIPSSQPVFNYYAYSGGQLSTTQLATPLSSSDAASAAEVTIGFVTAPSNNNTNLDRTVTLTDTVVLRLSPASPLSTVTNGPCS
jgi:prepilin-type N-terminal cleavage/methylation domain-containing protein